MTFDAMSDQPKPRTNCFLSGSYARMLPSRAVFVAFPLLKIMKHPWVPAPTNDPDHQQVPIAT